MCKTVLQWVSMCLCALLLGCSQEKALVAIVQPEEQTEIVATLARHQISAEVVAVGKGGSVQLNVPRDSLAQAQAILREEGLPRRRFDSLGTVFRKDGMVSSPFDERVRYVYAQAQEIENVISRIEGVVFVRVVLTIADLDANRRDSGPMASSAAVYIKHSMSSDLPERVTELKNLIARGIPQASEDQIALYMDVVGPPSRLANAVVSAASDDTGATWPPYVKWLAVVAGLLISLVGGFFGYRYWRQRVS